MPVVALSFALKLRSVLRAFTLVIGAILTMSSLVQAAEPGRVTLDPAFVLGADVSFIGQPGRGNYGPLPVYQENGETSDEITILHRHGWNAFRVRVFVSPVRKAPNNTIAAAIPLAKHIKKLGATLLLCMHFSDTWADPQHQDIPEAWRGLDIAGLEKAWEEHARDAIQQLKDAGAMPDWVQIGNEITRGTQWPVAQLNIPGKPAKDDLPAPYDEAVQWENLTRLIKAGIRGVKAASGDTPPRIAIHIDKGANWNVTQWFFDHIQAAKIDYDIIAQSFYPEWNHGTLDQVRENMHRCAERFGKDFLIVETGYGRSHVKENQSMLWPETPEGRLQFMAEIIRTVQAAPRGIGVMYWAPEREAWNADGTPGPVVFVREKFGQP